MVPDTIGLDRLSIAPLGPDSCASTITIESSDSKISELFSSTVQVTVTVDISLTGLGGILMIDTDAGGVTEERKGILIEVALSPGSPIATFRAFFLNIYFTSFELYCTAGKFGQNLIWWQKMPNLIPTNKTH